MAKLIDGKQISYDIKGEIKKDVDSLFAKTNKKPGLAVILVGEDPASQVYVRSKEKDCEEVGFQSFPYRFSADISEAELLKLIAELNGREDVDGILVQLPLPKHIDEKKVINAIDPLKDVDGFHPQNVGNLVIGDENAFISCTPAGCQELINRTVSDIKGKHVVVVGRSNIVGKPMANLMVQRNSKANCIVTVCHTATEDLSYYTKQADILVVAVGQPEIITADMVKEGVIVIDVGMNRIPHPEKEGKTKLVGDVKFSDVEPKASAITPVPGGVGPMTRTMLMFNTLKAFRIHNNLV